VGFIQQVRKHGSFTGLPVQKGSNQQDSFKKRRDSNRKGLPLQTKVKKEQGFLLMSGFQQAELPFLEGVQIGKSCDACKRHLQGSKENFNRCDLMPTNFEFVGM
jgi:hypothetical protein